jgi:hypothetical protein
MGKAMMVRWIKIYINQTSLQPHNYYNLYSDTAAYFLTWQLSAVQGKRIANFSEINVTNIPKEEFHQEERLLILMNEYSQVATK